MVKQGNGKNATALIIGGGIAGLTSALALRQSGLVVKVFEQADSSREQGAGVALWSNATQVLTQLGLGDLLHQVGSPITRLMRYTPAGEILTDVPLEPFAAKLGSASFAVHRAEFHQALLEALGREVVSLQARCTGFVDHEDGVEAQFADGQTVRGDLLIGADGIHSVITTQLFGQRPLRYAGYTTIRAITSFEHPFFCEGKIFQVWGPGALFGAVRLNGRRVYWYLQLASPAGSPKRTKAELQAQCQSWYEPIQALIEATEERNILQHDIYDCPPLAQWGRGNVTLVGDAAHPMQPALAQGACQAIEDAGVLGASLRERKDSQALRSYEQARMKRGAMVVRQSRLVGDVELWDTPPRSWLRSLLLVSPPRVLQEQMMQPIYGHKIAL